MIYLSYTHTVSVSPVLSFWLLQLIPFIFLCIVVYIIVTLLPLVLLMFVIGQILPPIPCEHTVARLGNSGFAYWADVNCVTLICDVRVSEVWKQTDILALLNLLGPSHQRSRIPGSRSRRSASIDGWDLCFVCLILNLLSALLHLWALNIRFF